MRRTNPIEWQRTEARIHTAYCLRNKKEKYIAYELRRLVKNNYLPRWQHTDMTYDNHMR